MTGKLVVNDGRTERELLLVANLVVGRDPMCDISGDDSLLSRRHAEFLVANGVRVRDLGSRNGVFVNGQKVAEAALRPGDLVLIGHFQLRYVEAGAAPVAAGVPAAVSPSPVMASTAAAAASVPATPPDDEEFTRLVRPPSRPSRSESPAPAEANAEDEEFTRVVSPPAASIAPAAVVPTPVAAPVPAAGAPLLSMNTLVIAPPETVEDEEFTRVVAAPVSVAPVAAAPAVAVKPAVAPPTPAQTPSPVTAVQFPSPVARPATGVSTAGSSSPASSADASLGGFVYVQLVVLAVLVGGAVAIPFVMNRAADAFNWIWPAISVVVIALVTFGVGANINHRLARALASADRGAVDRR